MSLVAVDWWRSNRKPSQQTGEQQQTNCIEIKWNSHIFFVKSVCKWMGPLVYTIRTSHKHIRWLSRTHLLDVFRMGLANMHRPFESRNLHLNLTSNPKAKAINIAFHGPFVHSFILFPNECAPIAETQRHHFTQMCGFRCDRSNGRHMLASVQHILSLLGCCGVEIRHKNWLKAIIWNYHRIFILLRRM